MPDERKYHVISDDNCKFESMTKEQILAAITQAIEGHSIADVDTGFVQTIKEQNKGTGLKFWIGTSAEYNALQTIDQNCFYILTDDTELEDMESDIKSFRASLEAMGETVSNQGQTVDNLVQTVGVHNEELNDMYERRTIVLFDADEDAPLPYNEAFLVPVPLYSSSSIDITNLSLVRVRLNSGDVLCTVSKSDNYGEEDYLFVRGSSPIQTKYFDPEQGSNFGKASSVVAYINMTIDAVNKTVLKNESVICVTNANNTGSEYAFKASVLKITGVM